MSKKTSGLFERSTTFLTNFYRRRGCWKTAASIVLIGFGLGIFAISFFVFLVWSGFFGALPDEDQMSEIQHPVASEVYSADSVLLGRFFIQDRTPVLADEIPQSLRDALIATEDVRFLEHSGIDVRSLARVAVKTLLLQKESSGGGSTITQQLAKNLFPRKSYRFLSLPINKVREMIIARRLERMYSKDEILVLYLNTIPFADNTYGVKTAADRFYSTSVADLTPDQSAMLVGMLKATHLYNPRLFPERARDRRNLVIAQMEKYGFISSGEKQQLQAKPLALNYNNVTHNSGLAPYFRAYLKRQLLTWCSDSRKPDGTPYNLYTDGLKIYTTIDSRLQAYAEAAMQQHMAQLQERFAGQLDQRKLEEVVMRRLRQLPQYRAMRESGMPEEQVLKELRKPVETRIFTWEGIKKTEMSFYDSVKHHIQFLQAGVLAMEPGSGAIRAWVGGIDYRFFQYDHVRPETRRQVGSTIKPLLYTAALEEGIGPCTYISARKTEYTNVDDAWTPQNTDEETYDKKYSMEGGLSGSVNTVSVRLLEKTGIRDAIVTARKMGITSNLPEVPSLALGTPSISMMEMVGAYGTLANKGKYVEPKYLLAITDRRGNVLQRFDDSDPAEAVSAESAQMMIHMLRSVVSQGTGSSLRSRYGITNDVAGKTGTTQLNVDGWFMAITPRLVIGTWVGADEPALHFRSTALGQGAATALPITAYFLQRVNKDKTLRHVSEARFEPLPAELAEALDCKTHKSGLNFFERLFNKKKKKTKARRFRGVQGERE